MNLVGVEQAINLSKQDRHSSWVKLAKQLKLKTWSEIIGEATNTPDGVGEVVGEAARVGVGL